MSFHFSIGFGISLVWALFKVVYVSAALSVMPGDEMTRFWCTYMFYIEQSNLGKNQTDKV